MYSLVQLDWPAKTEQQS